MSGRLALLAAAAIPLPALAAAVLLYPRLFPRETLSPAEAARTLAPGGKTIQVGGRAVHYVETGPPDAPAVVLLHGFLFHAAIWRDVAAALAPRFRCLAVDLLGFGFSDRPAAPGEARYGYDLWQDQLLGLLDALAIPRAHLVGQSLGAGTSAGFAAAHPDRAGRLVLICPSGIPNPASSTGGILTWPYIGEFLCNLPGTLLIRKVLQDFLVSDHTKLTDAFVAEIAAPTRIRGSAAALLWMMRNVDLGGIEPRIRAFGEARKPSLLIWGNEDRAIPVALAERWREIVRPREVVLLGRAGHCPPVERPEAVGAAIRAFLEKDCDA